MKRLSVICVFILVFFLYGTVVAEKGIIVNLKMPALPWSDSRLGEKLNMYLSTINHIPIIRYDVSDSTSFDNAGASFQDLIARGRKQKGRFLVDISVDRIDLERRKMTVFPMILCRYRVYAVLTGTLRIFDIVKERMIKLKEIDYRIKASDQWQLIDDDKHDPALLIPPDEKIVLFDQLEDEAALRLFKEIKDLTRGSSFGG